MTHVIRRIEVLTIPAGWESHIGHDPGRARLGWEVHGLWEPGAKVLKTCIRDLPEPRGLLLTPVRSFADEHAKSLLEGRYLGRLLVVGQPVLHVVYGHAPIGAFKSDVGDLWDPVIGAVAGSKEEHSSPVVGEVLRKLAGCARGFLSDIFSWIHGDVEGILDGMLVTGPSVIKEKGKKPYATDDLVKMWRGRDSGVDERIYPLDSKLRAAEPYQRRRRRHKRERGK